MSNTIRQGGITTGTVSGSGPAAGQPAGSSETVVGNAVGDNVSIGGGSTLSTPGGLSFSTGSTTATTAPTFGGSTTTAPPAPPPPPRPETVPASEQGWNLAGARPQAPPASPPPPPPPGGPPSLPAAGRLHPLVASLLGPTRAAQVENRLHQALSPLTGPPPMGPNPSAGQVSSFIQGQQRQYATSSVVPHGPTTSIDERGASANANYQDLAAFGKAHGSLDGTAITGSSTYGQDEFHLKESHQATTDHVNMFLQARRQASPQEQQVLARADRQMEKSGYPRLSTPDLLYRRQIMDGLYQQGQLPTGTPLQKSYQALSQSIDMQAKTESNVYHKWAQLRPPNAAPPKLSPLQQPIYASSPFTGVQTTPDTAPGAGAAQDAAPQAAAPPPRPMAQPQPPGPTRLDNTPITRQSTPQQDQASYGQVHQNTLRAAQQFVGVRSRYASPQEEGVLRPLEYTGNQAGYQPASTPDLLVRRDLLQQAYDKGALPTGTPVHQAFQAFSQAVDLQARTEANLAHKYPQQGTPQLSPQQQAYYAASPFASRPAAAPPPPPAAPGGTQQALQELSAIKRSPEQTPPEQSQAMSDAMMHGRPPNYGELTSLQRLVVDRNAIQGAVDQGKIPPGSPLGQAFSKFSQSLDQDVAAQLDAPPMRDQARLSNAHDATQKALQGLVGVQKSPDTPAQQRDALGQSMADARPANYGELSPLQRLVVDRNAIKGAIDQGHIPHDSPLASAFSSFSDALNQEVDAQKTMDAKAPVLGARSQVQQALQGLNAARQQPASQRYLPAMNNAMMAGRPANFDQLPSTTRLVIDRNSVMQAVQHGQIPANSPLGQAFGQFSTAIDGQVAAENQFATGPRVAAAPAPPPPPATTTAPAPPSGPPATVKVVQGDVARVPADALIAPINSGGMWFGAIDGVIQKNAGNTFHAQAAARDLQDGQTFVATGNDANKGAFKNVLFIVDDGRKPLSDLVYSALKTADQSGMQTVSLPALRMGVARGNTPAQVNVDAMAGGVKQFLADNPQNVKDITFAVYNDPQTASMLDQALKS